MPLFVTNCARFYTRGETHFS